MLKQVVALCAALSFSLCADSHWNWEQVADYVHHSELQRRSNWHLLSQIRFRGDESLLDVGCGDGRNTALLASLLPYGRVVGVDPSPAMIAWAQSQYHPFDFPNVTFLDGDASHLPEETFEVITSLFSLHLVEDKGLVIRAFFDHLEEGGCLIATIPPEPTNAEFGAAVRDTIADPQWAPYFRDFRSTFHFEPLDAYARYFHEAGFCQVHVRYVPSMDPFVNREELVGWLMGTWPHIHCLPLSVRREFVTDLVERYVQYRPDALSAEGVVYGYFGHYEVVAWK